MPLYDCYINYYSAILFSQVSSLFCVDDVAEGGSHHKKRATEGEDSHGTNDTDRTFCVESDSCLNGWRPDSSKVCYGKSCNYCSLTNYSYFLSSFLFLYLSFMKPVG